MSFEGYHQRICQYGHYWEDPFDYGYDDPGKPILCDCGKPVVWDNLVDDTNLDDMYRIPMEPFQFTPPTRTEKPTYRIPTPEETQKLRNRPRTPDE